MFLKFDEEVRKILLGAKREMKLLKHPYIGTEHLVLSIIKRNNFITSLLSDKNVTYEVFYNEVISLIGMGNKQSNLFIYTPLLKKIIQNAMVISKERNLKEVNLNSLFAALLEEGEGVGIRIFISMGIDVDELYEEVNIKRKQKKLKNKLLIDDFGVNLNKKALDGELDPVIGRDDEVLRVIEILCRRTKNNPLLIGDAGVGKTAIVEELSRRIVNGKVPLKLLNKRIVSISMASLVSGTKYRGEFEDRVTKMLSEVEEANDVIIFIDEIHTLVGAGGAEGAIDASNILKPALARGKVNIIGATTTYEYKKIMEDDKALARRFQNIVIEEPNVEKVYDILTRIKPIYEEYHNVLISEKVLKLIVNLSDKYLYNRKQPDKSIDILDEVCSKLSIVEDEFIKKNTHYKNLLKNVVSRKNDAIINGRFNDAICLREEEIKLEGRINRLEIKIMKHDYKREVTCDMVANVIKQKSNIPVYEFERPMDVINSLKKYLLSNVIGQDFAIEKLCNITKKMFFGIKADKRPISFLFVGQSGVGKTHLAKEYNKFLFRDENLIRVDMSEYKEEHSISKIIGSPPGYVGYQNKSTLLEEIKDKPHSVVLLDEIEKAHSSVLNLFLQILDEGHIKDSNGNIYRFDNNIIIMTSNAGCDVKNIGFDNSKVNVVDIIKNSFSSEFINRIDNIILFNSFNYNDVFEITKRLLESIVNKFKVNFNYDDNFIDSIVKESKYDKFGARKLEKIIMEKLDFCLFDNSINNGVLI
ncbi:MAG: ATP-dependent Clp protease ATP-binding subunit [Bacilli bacterium]|nr:ATP-dependent Clp protease ATP-binding subunit [Bacilli bacterium]